MAAQPRYDNQNAAVANRVERWRWAAQNDADSNAMYQLGGCYYYGSEGLAIDRAQAVRWYKEGARLENVDCMRDLGICYYNGDGIGRHYGQALHWFAKAAHHQDAMALFILGRMHEKGQATPINLTRALSRYQDANVNGQDCLEDIARVTNAISAEQARHAAHQRDAARAAVVDERRKIEDQQQQEVTAWLTQETARLGQIEARLEQEEARLARSAQEQQAAHARLAEEQRHLAQVNADRARLVQENTRLAGIMAQLRADHAAVEAERVRLQAMRAAAEAQEVSTAADRAQLQQRAVQLQREQQALAVERTRVEQLQATVQRDRDALDAVERERRQRAEAEAAKAAQVLAAHQQTALAKQAELVGGRSLPEKFQPARAAVATALEPTTFDLHECPVCLKTIQSGTSVLLSGCLHGLCRTCAPQMLGRDGVPGTIKCPLCEARTSFAHPQLPLHPFIEAKLAALVSYACGICQNVPDADERMDATFKCETCGSIFCEAHAGNHRKRHVPAHVVIPLPHHGGARRCSTHDQPIAAYCSCGTFVCPACTLAAHRGDGHEHLLLNDEAFVASVRRRLEQGVAAARRAASTLVDLAAQTALATTELSERDAAMKAEIDRNFETVNSFIDRQRITLYNDCLHRSEEERRVLLEMRAELEHSWRVVTSAADLAHQLASGAHLGQNAVMLLIELEAGATQHLRNVIERARRATSVPPTASLRVDIDGALATYLASLSCIAQDAPGIVRTAPQPPSGTALSQADAPGASLQPPPPQTEESSSRAADVGEEECGVHRPSCVVS